MTPELRPELRGLVIRAMNDDREIRRLAKRMGVLRHIRRSMESGHNGMTAAHHTIFAWFQDGLIALQCADHTVALSLLPDLWKMFNPGIAPEVSMAYREGGRPWCPRR